MDVLLIFGLVFLLFASYLMYKMHFGNIKQFKRKKRLNPASVMIVVGSGGHTREVLSLVSQLSQQYSPRYYVVADTDKMSEEKIHAVEKFREEKISPSEYRIIKIPRSREVKQSWISTVLSTLHASICTFPVVFKRKPEIILCNGPGTCIPVCVSGLILKWLNIQPTMIVYVESICRVTSLSLSGRILYHFADFMFVQWPSLQKKYPKCQYIGRIA